ncbi:MAG: cation:proton antiporter [Candidatus Micrarchaeota archaeon]|nr:cation:proton antiporter [Candidatus Micrarchaeota archaeon]
MAESSILLEFAFFIVFALLGTVVSLKLRQPYVVGLLIFGALAGPHILGLVSDTSLISTFSELGAILLLFAIGIEFSVSKILKSGFRAVAITLAKMLALFFFGYELAIHFNLDLTTSLFAGAIISITSTAILYKIVSQKGMAKHPLLPLLFSMLIVEDIVAVAALTFFSSIGSTSATYEDKFYSVLIALGLLGAFYLFVRRHVSKALARLMQSFTEEVAIFLAFSVCLVMSLVAAFFGLTPAIGAFLAGSIVSSLPNARKIESTMKPLLLMFAALFFLSLGMRIDPSAVIANLPFAASLTAVFVFVCFIAVFTLLYITGATPQSAVFGASAMVVMGEFSLLIASEATGEYSGMLLAVGSFGVVISAIVSSFLLDKQERTLLSLRSVTPSWFKSSAYHLSLYFGGLVRDFSPKGNFWKVSRACWRCVAEKLIRIAAIAFLAGVMRFLLQISKVEATLVLQLRWAIFIFAILPILYYLYQIFKELKPVFDALSHTIARHREDSADEQMILRNLVTIGVLIFIAANLPDIVRYLQLPAIFDFADDVFFVLALIFAWDLLRHAARLHQKRKKIRARAKKRK